jgi:hypothetical protein
VGASNRVERLAFHCSQRATLQAGERLLRRAARTREPFVGLEISGETCKLDAQLQGVADLIDNGDLWRMCELADKVGAVEALEGAARAAGERFQRTLTGLRSFRRNYDYWERVIAESR